MKTLPTILCKATPAACLLGLTLFFTGCTPDQDEPLSPYVRNNGYEPSAVALPQDTRHHKHTPHPAQTHHHAAPPAEFPIAGN